MATLTYEELTTVPTQDEEETTLLGMMDVAGLPTTAWAPKSVPRTLVKLFAKVGVTIAEATKALAKGGYLATADDAWMPYVVESAYAETAKPATSTVGQATLTNNSGSPIVIAIGQLWAQDASGRRFTNTTGGTLLGTGGSTLTGTWQAESPGAGYNLPNDTLTSLATPLPGVTIGNPAIGTTGTWITSAGSDAEKGADLAERARGKWATLGTGGPAPAYAAWARAASTTVTRVKVDDTNPDGPQTVHVYLANATGAATPTEIATVDAALQAKKAVTARVTTSAATPHLLSVTATIYVQSAYSTTALPDALENLTALGQTPDIGETIYLSEFIGALTSPTGVVRAELHYPIATPVFGANEVLTLSVSVVQVLV